MKSVAILKSTISHLGGLEKYSLKIAQAFHAAGCNVRLITTGAVPKEKIPSLLRGRPDRIPAMSPD